MKHNGIAWPLLLSVMLTLSACGGGGSSSSEPLEPPAAPAPIPKPPAPSVPAPEPELKPQPVTPPTSAQAPTPRKAVKNYIFGHSLINHANPTLPTRPNETAVPHWLQQLAQAAGKQYSVSGKYGFLRNYTELPPNAQWGFKNVPGAWDDDSPLRFADVNFTTVLITAGNFIQYQPATVPYDGDNRGNVTPLQATLQVVDWLVAQEPGIEIYIYENWPDMAGHAKSFPPSASEFASYNAHVVSGFHAWWIDYHDALLEARPAANVKMIPVGPIISNLLTNTNLSGIAITELYEDDAPHGRPTLYFLASLVTYMAIYGAEAPADFPVPATVDSLVRDNYANVVSFIWSELQNFDDGAGNSRVW